MKSKLLPLLSLVILPLAGHAQALTVLNPSFESPATPTFDFNITDWFMANQGTDDGIEAVQNEGANPNIPDTDFGANWANIANDGTLEGAIYQQIGTFQNGFTYDISNLFVGQRSNSDFDGLRVSLYSGDVTGANGTNLSSISGTTLLTSFDINKADFFPTSALGTATVPTFTLEPTSYATAGEALWIHFSVLGQGDFQGTVRPQTLFDNVEVTAIPEPSTYAVIFGLVALGFIVRRRRKAGQD